MFLWFSTLIYEIYGTLAARANHIYRGLFVAPTDIHISSVHSCGRSLLWRMPSALFHHIWFMSWDTQLCQMRYIPGHILTGDLHVFLTELLSFMSGNHNRYGTQQMSNLFTWACRRIVSLSRVLNLCRTLYGAYFVPTWAASRFGSFSLANSAYKENM